MEVMLKEEKKLFSEAGICFLEAICVLPELSDGKKAEKTNLFYTKLRTAFFACAEAAARTEKEHYETSGDPRRRFTHRPLRLSLRTRLSEKDESGSVSCVRVLTLTRRGKTLYEKESRELLGPDGALIVPRAVPGKKPAARKKEKAVKDAKVNPKAPPRKSE